MKCHGVAQPAVGRAGERKVADSRLGFQTFRRRCVIEEKRLTLFPIVGQPPTISRTKYLQT